MIFISGASEYISVGNGKESLTSERIEDAVNRTQAPFLVVLIHTNDETVRQWLDVKPFLTRSSLLGILAKLTERTGTWRVASDLDTDHTHEPLLQL
jgi:hypothetical protein